MAETHQHDLPPSPHLPPTVVGPASTPRVASPLPTTSSSRHDKAEAAVRRRGTRGAASSDAEAADFTGRAAEAGGGPDEEVDGEVDLYMLRWGYALVGGSATCFLIGVWSISIGPYTETTGIWILDALASDTYYNYLTVLLVPVTVCFVIVNWWGLKIFRHA
ncbi:hypothetical protein JCM10207_007705 [Rhodosporidiobolus poonsookiae]